MIKGNGGAYTHQTVHGRARLSLNIATLLLAVLHSGINKTSIARLSRRREDERRVGGRILGLVDVDCCTSMSDRRITWSPKRIELTLEVTRVRDDNGASLLEVVERGSHFGGWGTGKGRCETVGAVLSTYI